MRLATTTAFAPSNMLNVLCSVSTTMKSISWCFSVKSFCGQPSVCSIIYGEEAQSLRWHLKQTLIICCKRLICLMARVPLWCGDYYWHHTGIASCSRCFVIVRRKTFTESLRSEKTHIATKRGGGVSINHFILPAACKLGQGVKLEKKTELWT